MTNYKVKLTFKYSDTVHVEAEDREEAVAKALFDCQEVFESFYDAEVEEED